MSSRPSDVIDLQVRAHNVHNLDALLATYAPDAQLLRHPDKVTAKGIAEIRAQFVERFQTHPRIYVAIVGRLCTGPYVVDLEEVFTEGEGVVTRRTIVSYEVRDGLIVRVMSMRT